MARTIVKPDNQNISIKLPEDFVSRQVEVIIFTIEETHAGNETTNRSLMHFASQKILAGDWLTPDEDAAWRDL
jgi:hypothetical protein